MALPRWIRYLDAKDLELFRRATRWEVPEFEKTLPKLSRAANKSVLWMGIATLLWLVGGRRGRRAAARGLIAVGMTSPIANLFGKLLTRRPRPLIDEVPMGRRLARIPRSSSFPSGHSASAFAFATGAALEAPFLTVPLAPLAAGVAYSRIYTGVHYPGDVIAGSLLGASVAVASRSFWPLTPRDTIEHRQRSAVDIEPRPEGEGLVLAVNTDAGSGLGTNTAQILRERLPQADIKEIEIDSGNELVEALESIVDTVDVLGIAGGDGSVNAAAQIALDHKKPLMVVPGGTLNHLARDLGLDDAEQAIDAVRDGHAIALDVGRIDGHVFLNTASFGAYPDLVHAREKLEEKIGKWPAMVVALIRVLRRGAVTDVEIDGVRRRIWMIFIGNCRYHPSGFAPSWRERLDDGKLDIRIVDASAPLARMRLIASVLTGRLGRCRIYEQRLAERVEVRSLEGPLRLARDGEVFEGPESFVVDKMGDRLTVYSPVE
ncbi:MAG TPA: phosphatase PAP2 family protein [Actinomycetota bacterium]|nr:phosphatase PAP2 family protein [Actinomycetota bacterium]